MITAFVILWLVAGASTMALGLALTGNTLWVNPIPLILRGGWKGRGAFALLALCWIGLTVLWPLYVPIYYSRRSKP